jgi:hypothetical protein
MMHEVLKFHPNQLVLNPMKPFNLKVTKRWFLNGTMTCLLTSEKSEEKVEVDEISRVAYLDWLIN